jgi:hypothetical protein
MSQLALVYEPHVTGADDWMVDIEWVRRAVDVVGHKEVAFKLDIAPAQLADALHERERKDVKEKWIPILLRMVPPDMCAEYLRVFNARHGYEARPIKIRTAAEENREMRELLKVHAPSVLSIIDKELGR